MIRLSRMCFFVAVVVMFGGFGAGAAPDGGGAVATKPSPVPVTKKAEVDSTKKGEEPSTKVAQPAPRKAAIAPSAPEKTKQGTQPKP